MRLGLLFYLMFYSLTVGAASPETNGNYQLYLVRHAEKQSDGSKDPLLTEAGAQRANQLAQWFQDKDIKKVWSSDYHRTRDTAKPSLTILGLEPGIYDPRDLATFSEKLLRDQKTAIIVGHSNTTPVLASLLCKCEVADMDETEYDRLIVISVSKTETQVKTLQQDRLFKP